MIFPASPKAVLRREFFRAPPGFAPRHIVSFTGDDPAAGPSSGGHEGRRVSFRAKGSPALRQATLPVTDFLLKPYVKTPCLFTGKTCATGNPNPVCTAAEPTGFRASLLQDRGESALRILPVQRSAGGFFLLFSRPVSSFRRFSFDLLFAAGLSNSKSKSARAPLRVYISTANRGSRYSVFCPNSTSCS